MFNQSEIENSICKITCGNDFGSGFLVSPNKILTARHNLDNYFNDEEDIVIYFPNSTKKRYKVLTERLNSENESVDAIVIEIEENMDLPIFRLATDDIAINSKWNSFGYFNNDVSSTAIGAGVSGKITRIIKDKTLFAWDLQATIDESYDDVSGLSGAPLIINGYVYGILIKQKRDILGILSVKESEKFLEIEDIGFIKRSDELSLPDSIKKNVDDSIPNDKTFIDLDNKLLEGNHQYIILQGRQGSGKTTLIGSYTPLEENVIICGKYFIDIPNDRLPTAIRSKTIVLIKWLRNAVSKILTNNPADLNEKDEYELLLELIESYENLNNYLIKNDKIGVFFIDGIDEIYRLGELDKFWKIFPSTLPSNIIFVFSSNKNDFYPVHMIDSNQKNIINISVLNIFDCESYIFSKLKNKDLTYNDIVILAKLSEGNPLYLNYICNYISKYEGESQISEIIDKIPHFSGDIENYYNLIWNDVKDSAEKIWILATIARLRESLEPDLFIKTLPEKNQYSFVAIFPQISHLTLDSETVLLSHSSLRNFILKKTEQYENEIHKNISLFCEQNNSLKFSKKNYLYHLSHSTEDDIYKSIRICNQEWIDHCGLNFITPEVILNDIQYILSLSLSQKLVKDSIQILLLLQRLKFRFNNIFIENAASLCKLLIEIGLIDEALAIIIREDMLIISNDDSLTILNRLYELNEFNKADSLFKAIRNRVIFLYESIEDKDEGIPYKLLELELLSNMIHSNDKTEYSQKLLLKNIKKFNSIFSAKNPDHVYATNALMGYANGYNLMKNGFYFSVQDFLQIQEFKSCKDYTVMLAQIILNFDVCKRIYLSDSDDSLLDQVIYDLENMYEEHGSSDETIVLNALIQYSHNYQLVCQLINKNRIKPEINLRKKNGVDVNWTSIVELFQYFFYESIVSSDINDLIFNDSTEEWENILHNLIKEMGYLYGLYTKFLHDECSLKDLEDKIKSYITIILNLELDKRIYWNRSYKIPEEIIPFVYDKLVVLITKLDSDIVEYFVNELLTRMNPQFGVYSEGYIAILYNICNVLLPFNKYNVLCFKINKLAEQHVIEYTLNRWDRSESLINISYIYARIENIEKSKEILNKMLLTSMGPSWYKEDQFTLLSSSINNLLIDNNFEIDYYKSIEKILNISDGELTFQRYVRQSKHEHIANLCKSGKVKDAINYFKEQSYPESHIIIENIKKNSADKASIEKGYRWGCNKIVPHAGIICLLENLRDVDDRLLWSLTELFIVSSDDRYLSRYTILQCSIVNKYDQDSPYNKIFINRIIKLLVTEMDDIYSKKYLKNLKKSLNTDNYKLLISELHYRNFKMNDDDINVFEENKKNKSINTDNTDQGIYLPGVYGKRSALKELEDLFNQANEAYESEQTIKAKSYLVNGIKTMQDQGWDIWSNNCSNTLSKSEDLLFKLTGSMEEYIFSIKDIVVNESYSYTWRIANHLIGFAKDKLDENTSKDILDIILEHFEIILNKDVIVKFRGEDEENHTNSDLLFNFIVWFLNYPEYNTKAKVIEILWWLSNIEPDYFIPLLVEETINTHSPNRSIISSILLRLTMDNNQIVWKYLQDNSHYKEKISFTNHFLTRVNYLKIIEQVKGKSDLKDKFRNDLLQKFISNNMDEKYGISDSEISEFLNITPITSILNSLEEEYYVDDNFRPLLIELLSKSEFHLNDITTMNKYIADSFNNKLYRYKYNFIIENLNLLSNDYANKFTYPDLYNELISFNLSLSDCNLELYNNIFTATIKNFIKNEIIIENQNFFNEDNLLVYLHILSENKELNKNDIYELEAVFYNSNCDIFQIIAGDRFSLDDGGIFKDIKFISETKSRFNIDDNKLNTKFWRFGRNCQYNRFGMPIESGVYSYIPREELKKFPEYLNWGWIIRDFNNQVIRLYDPFLKRIIK